MTIPRQIITPGDQGDVPPHEHDATEVSGVFNFFRALRAVIDGDLTLRGFLRTGESGPRIEIRPDSGAGDVPSVQWFDADGQTGFIEMEDQGSDTWALKIAGPADSGSASAIIKLREDGIGVLDSDDANGFWEFFKPIAASAALDIRIGGSNTSRFTADGLITGPLGVLGYAEVTSSQLNITTETDLTGLSVTVDVAASRRIRITGSGLVNTSANNNVSLGRIREGTSELGRWMQTRAGNDDTTIKAEGFTVVTPSEGSHTYKLQLEHAVGGGNTDLVASTAVPACIVVEDLGPA